MTTLLKRLGISSLIILLAASIILDIGYICFCIFNKDITTGINNIGEQDALDTEVLDPEDADDPRNHEWFIEAQYYSNENNNGIALQEIKFNSFDAPTLLANDRKRQVMQLVGDDVFDSRYLDLQLQNWNVPFLRYTTHETTFFSDYVTSPDNDITKNTVASYFNYYTSSSDDLYADWKGLSSSLSRGTSMIVKIGNKPYMIRLNGSKYAGTRPDWYFLWIPVGSHDVWMDYFYGMVFYDVMSGVMTNSIGEGTFYTKIDLSRYFTVTHEYNEETKRWEDAKDGVDQLFTYSGIKFTYSKDGATDARESLAHSINYDPSFTTNKYDYNTDYWQERVKCTLTAKDLEYRYSETLGGYLVSMPLSMKQDFKNMPKLEVTIDLNLNDEYLTSRKINVIGLDYNAFENLRMKTLIIRGSGDFTCLTNSLNNTHLTFLEHSKNLTLIMQDDVINTEYSEVVL